MPRYKRRPVEVDAVKITRAISIETTGNTMKGNPGDYLITEVNGEQYPCNAELFEQEYELVKDRLNIKALLYKSLRKLKRKSRELIPSK
ncbi:hypothetical protein [Alteribacter populi]|uniref:hypothetical protein n=1 Tax=Alteribacter populi TaxID=2011011 RepID=UPI000BBA59CE|nr:hypothetical protein [Alteribacter populi]